MSVNNPVITSQKIEMLRKRDESDLTNHLREKYPGLTVKIVPQITWTDVDPVTKEESIRVEPQNIQIFGQPDNFNQDELLSKINSFVQDQAPEVDVELQKLEALLLRSPTIQNIINALPK
jgi:hypothetical protein